MNAKRLTALMLSLCLLVCLAACSGGETASSTQPTDTQPQTQQTTVPTLPADTTPPDDGKVTYTVTVVDEGGNPIAGAMVQLCLESCFPSVTDAQGVATYRVVEADYKVSFLSLPAGFDYTGSQTEFYFESGSYELTITLKAVA